MNRWRLTTMAAAAMLAASGCGGSGHDDAAVADGVQPAVAPATGSGSALADPERARAVDAYEYYLSVADSVRNGLPVEALDPVAAPSVIEQVVAWKAENEALAADELDVVDYGSWTNVETVEHDGDRVVIRDCLEVIKGPRVNIARVALVDYIDQLVTLVPSDNASGYLVDDLTVISDTAFRSGATPADGLGCVPASLRASIADALPGLISTYDDAFADPAGADPEALADLMSEPLLSDSLAALAGMTEAGTAASGREVPQQMVVLGSQADRNEAIVVQVCSAFPDGRQFNGDTPTVMPVRQPGEVIEVRYVIDEQRTGAHEGPRLASREEIGPSTACDPGG